MTASLQENFVSTTVFIDGDQGTAGLQIIGRLSARADLRVATLPGARRKEARARAEARPVPPAGVLPLPEAPGIDGRYGVYFTGMIMYMLFFGCYATLTWVIPSESYPTYLRSYGMTTSSGFLFLCSFIITYNFRGMQDAMTKQGLSMGFFGGIALLGWVYQLLFMPETKGKTLEEIDLIFERPTRSIVAENIKNIKETTSDLCHFRFKKVFIDDNKAKAAVALTEERFGH